MSFLVITVDPWCCDRKTSGVGWIVPHHPSQSGYHPENVHSNYDRKTSGVGWILPHHPSQSGYHPENVHSNYAGYPFDGGGGLEIEICCLSDGYLLWLECSFSG